jgi:hypothetical protein
MFTDSPPLSYCNIVKRSPQRPQEKIALVLGAFILRLNNIPLVFLGNILLILWYSHQRIHFGPALFSEEESYRNTVGSALLITVGFICTLTAILSSA